MIINKAINKYEIKAQKIRKSEKKQKNKHKLKKRFEFQIITYLNKLFLVRVYRLNRIT
jgi:hypothetical protein